MCNFTEHQWVQNNWTEHIIPQWESSSSDVVNKCWATRKRERITLIVTADIEHDEHIRGHVRRQLHILPSWSCQEKISIGGRRMKKKKKNMGQCSKKIRNSSYSCFLNMNIFWFLHLSVTETKYLRGHLGTSIWGILGNTHQYFWTKQLID